MNLFTISSVIVIISNFSIAVFLLSKGLKNLTNKVFFCIAASGGIWGLGTLGFSMVPFGEPGRALFYWKIACLGSILTPVFFTHFIFSYLGLKKRFFILVIYCLGVIFLIFNFFKPKLFLGEVRFLFNDFYWLDWRKSKSLPYLIFYLGFYWALLPYTFFLLLSFYKRVSGIARMQAKYIILGSVIGWLGPEFLFLPIFGIDIYPVSNFFIAFYPLIFAYAVIKYRLMDVTVAITRTGIFIAVYTVVLGIPFALAVSYKELLLTFFGVNWWMWPLILMAVLATSGPFIYIFLERKAEDRLLKEQRRYQDTLKQASVGMTRIRDLKRLLDLIAHIITKTVRITYVGIYLYDVETDQFLLQVSRDKGRVPIPKLTSHNPLITWINLKREPLVYEEIKRQMQDTNQEVFRLLEENMRLLYASVIVPSFLEDRFMGFIVLGDKVSGKIYSFDDLDVFQVLASQAALAVENAQFYEETKQMQEQVAQAEKMATIGTMADGLSHQINNRFYALSLIAGDTIDTIKTADTSKCSPEVKDMIEQVNHALDRIQTNVIQGGEVVKGILKYTRKGDEGFEPLTLDNVLDGTLDMVQYKIKLSEIDIVRGYPKDTPKIKGNLVQLEEVFFNFIDNAYDAIVERRTMLEDQDYRGRITIFAVPKEDNLEIIIEDNGMGIKDDSIKKIFTPFFTTKTSSRKGTGLGLYVIRRIIADIHKGKIGFESAYKVGTRFIIELPIAG
jgi:signal transduction histidine kinase